jgi:TatD DNase family protein
LIDTHCHLYLEQFNDEIEDVIREADEIGVHQILVPGIDAKTSNISISLSLKYPDRIYSCVGIHPNYSAGSSPHLIEELIQFNPTQVHAIGEIGLDFFRDFAPRKTQIDLLEKQLDLAKKYQLPICIHNREADKELVKILDEWYLEKSNFSRSGQFGVFHAFNGSEEIAEWGKTHAFAFGIGGPLTFKKSSHFREIVKQIGLDHLVLETDAPYLSPVPFRGKRNVPKNLEFIVDELACLFNCSKQQVEEITDNNAIRLFRIKKKCQENGILS